jgi:hypothetical protein
MLQKLINSFIHQPMWWDVIIPLVLIAIFCAILYWEGLYGHISRAIKKLKDIKAQ